MVELRALNSGATCSKLVAVWNVNYCDATVDSLTGRFATAD